MHTLSKSRLSQDMFSSGIVKLATKSIMYVGPFLTSMGIA